MRVLKRIAAGGDAASGVGIDAYDAQMIALRDQVAEAKPEDVAPLVEQLTRMQGIAAQRGRARALPVNPGSPYFGHLRLREAERRRDVLIGKRGFIDRNIGIQIVDWRNAPVSRIYYRYEEGDDFDEHFEGGDLSGEVEVRRNVAISGGRLRRVGSPAGTYTCDAHGVWWAAEGEAAPSLAGGQGKAARPPRPQPGQGRGARLGVHSGARPRADKHLPENRRAHRQGPVRAHHAAAERPGPHPGRRRLGQDHGGVAPRGLPQLRGLGPLQVVAHAGGGAVGGAGALRGRCPAFARGLGRAGRDLPGLGALDPAARPAALARPLQRRHAGRGRASEEAPRHPQAARAERGRAGRGRARGAGGGAGARGAGLGRARARQVGRAEGISGGPRAALRELARQGRRDRSGRPARAGARARRERGPPAEEAHARHRARLGRAHDRRQGGAGGPRALGARRVPRVGDRRGAVVVRGPAGRAAGEEAGLEPRRRARGRRRSLRARQR